jgi:hypothetical protein
MFAAGTNTGDGCATGVSGITTITSAAGLTYPYSWSLSGGIRAGAVFGYDFGHAGHVHDASNIHE